MIKSLLLLLVLAANVNVIANSDLPLRFQQFLLNRNPPTQCLP
jgi:hypothetical protein